VFLSSLLGQQLLINQKLSINAWSLARNTEIFGSDAEYFRPERWIDVAKETYSRMERALDAAVFGYGRYRCLGAPVARMEFDIIFVELLRRFEFTVLNPSAPMTSTSHGVWVQSEFLVRIVERQDLASW
jgi:cytochrome P450